MYFVLHTNTRFCMTSQQKITQFIYGFTAFSCLLAYPTYPAALIALILVSIVGLAICLLLAGIKDTRNSYDSLAEQKVPPDISELSKEK